MKKWGKIGAPHSHKRKLFLKRVRKSVKRKYKGYGSRRSWKADHTRRARHKPAKHYRKGIGNRGDW